MGVTDAEIHMHPPDLRRDIRSRIETALVQMARIDAERIYVEVDGSKVTLNGTVSSFAEEREVVKAARSTRGVVVVEDRLVVTIA